MDHGESSYRRFLAGDCEGMREIVSTYRAGLMLYLNSLVQNMQTAEELTEDTFFELMRKRPDFAGRSTFKTWLYAIGGHVAAKYLRRHAKLRTVPLDSQVHLAGADNLERGLIRTEQHRMVHRAMQTLKPEYRQVLYLSFFEEFSNAETARIMKKSDKQIRDLLYHAKKALKTELERSGFEYEE